ncbi:MAG: aminotransferase class I/II-fold pyridoxal phosphate-dependent enzyme [Halobacteria archaeon]|nr:aminotransferase class I/II-fold pyridoxal phosphate-dependent enzyme [Halobacteria archaeon]
MEFKDQLKCFGGQGHFDKVLSTSNLYLPDFDRVSMLLSENRPSSDNEYPLSTILESRLCEYHNAEHCVLYSSGFWALVAAIKLKAIAGKSNVIIPSMTYRRLADLVHWAGKIPVFVDVYEDGLAVSVEAVREAIDNDTALILAVHPIVNCCHVDSFIELSARENVPVIFDAVESVHETYKGKRIGSFGVGEVFSFHASKLINGCEGGYICTNEADFATDLRSFRDFCVVDSAAGKVFGLDARPIDGHAAFALAGLMEIDKNVAHNREIYSAYKKYLPDVHGLRLLEFDENEQTSYKNIVIEVMDDYPVSRDILVRFLNDEGLLARSHYDPPLHAKEYSYGVSVKGMANTNKVRTKFINMPCGSVVSVGDVEIIIQILKYIEDDTSLNTLLENTYISPA